MLEMIDPRQKIDKDTYKQWFPRLKAELRELQQKAREANLPIIVILDGFRLAGRSDIMWHISQSLDPRGFLVHSRVGPSEEEISRHWLWRYWMRMPPRGKFSFFENSWYSRVLRDRILRKATSDQWSRAFQEINQTEEMLIRDGALIVKFWLQISRKDQKKRIAKARKNPYGPFTLTKLDIVEHERYDEFAAAAEEMLERTSTHLAPWTVVESEKSRFRRLKIFQTLSEQIVSAINERERSKRHERIESTAPGVVDITTPALVEMPRVLDTVDLASTVSEEEYDKKKDRLQIDLRRLQYQAIDRGARQIVVFEGWDAAGKGGTIRRMTSNLDPHYYDVIPIGKPTEEELAHHYLWRFWKYLPRRGHLTIYDRSWYGRVLVERIEGFCTEAEWRRAYEEINEFELKLVREGISVAKFWLHISNDEQLRRFEARREDPNKSWKLTDEDWRNREKWDQYYEAVEDMVTRTSTPHAPWQVVPANCKRFARVHCMKTLLNTFREDLKNADKPRQKKKK